VQRPRLLVLVRHAESVRNQAKKGSTYFADDEARRTVKGIPDYKGELTSVGVAQAEATGHHLRERFGLFDYVYHSGYLRALQTAEHILDAYLPEERNRMPVRHNAFIRERDPGYAYDMTEAEAEAAFPWLADHWQTFGGFFAHPPGGESLAMVAQRVYLFLNMLFRDRAGQSILVVTHGGTLRCFRFLLERWDYDQAQRWAPGQAPRNCGITVYEYSTKERRLLLREYNTVCFALD
jgi:2,3-bisphosphoglycerate-dependent phosphoglycerate mutase